MILKQKKTNRNKYSVGFFNKPETPEINIVVSNYSNNGILRKSSSDEMPHLKNENIVLSNVSLKLKIILFLESIFKMTVNFQKDYQQIKNQKIST